MKNSKTLFITQAAIIATIYTALVLIFQYSSFGPVQFRIAEALTILPYFTPAAIPGVSIGCFLSAILTGANILDIIFGSLASLVAAVLSYALRRNKYLVPIPPIVVNALVVPFILKAVSGEAQSIPIPIMMLSVGGGQFVSAGILGLLLLMALNRHKDVIFRGFAATSSKNK